MTKTRTVSLTAIILTFNNERLLPACLESVQWADEIIIYDSGSTDNTHTIAGQYNATVIIDNEWSGFGVQRQKAQQQATSDWLLWVDSDEVVSVALRQSIECALVAPEAQNVYSINRLSDFFGKPIRHSGWYPDRIVRLHSREHYRYNDAIVHEKIDCPTASVLPLAGDLLHYTTDSFLGYMSKSLRYANDWAQASYAKGRRVSVLGITMRTLFAFVRKFIIKKGFLDGRHGFLLAMQSSHYTFNKYFALWSLQQKK